MQVPPYQVVPHGFCLGYLLLVSSFSPGRGHRRAGTDWGCCQEWDPNPRAPLLLGIRRTAEPAGIERGTWTVELAASRGHCLRPRGSIRRALGVKYHFQSRPGYRGSWEEAGMAQGGLLRMRGPAVERELGLSVRGAPPGLSLGFGSPEITTGGPAGPPELTAPPHTHQGMGAELGLLDSPVKFGATERVWK